MRRYELVTVVTNGHRIEGRRGLILAFFGKILAFFGNKRAILQLFTGVTVVTAVTDGPRWSQVVTVGHRIGEGWVRPWAQPPGITAMWVPRACSTSSDARGGSTPGTPNPE